LRGGGNGFIAAERTRRPAPRTGTQVRDSRFTHRGQQQPQHTGICTSTEIGFLIPRDLFDGILDQLIKELGVINRIIRAFSEVTIGGAQPIEVRQISTSDPVFFLCLNPITIAALAAAVAWALDQWKKVEEIRKLRSETKKNTSFNEEEIREFFDSKIDKTIKKAIEEKVSEILPEPKRATGRIHEQRTDLAWALESILARVERGMRVEVRLLPPEAPPAEAEGEAAEKARAFQSLNETVPQLVFPPADPSPVLELPPPEPNRAGKRGGEGPSA
jgi:hypothetical protein